MFGGFKKSRTFATAIERESDMPVTHGVTGSSPVRTAKEFRIYSELFFVL